MIDRYLTPAMRTLWSSKTRWQVFLKVEQQVLKALSEAGYVPSEAYEASLKIQIDLVDIEQREIKLKHDVLAFVEHCASQMGPWGRYFHWGLTSSDVIDTGINWLVARSLDVILHDLVLLLQTAVAHFGQMKGVLTVGRTHGQWAQVTSVRLKGARFIMEWVRSAQWLRQVRQQVAVAKLSGPVGTYGLIGPHIEARVAQALGLTPEMVASQVVSRDRYSDVYYAIARLLSTYENFTVEVRHLQRSEVQEAREPFEAGQKGSSVMPHKRNPILSENMSGLARMARSFVHAGLENIPLWHERDISHSSVERVFLPDSLALGHWATVRMRHLISGLEWLSDQLAHHVEQAKGYLMLAQVLNLAVAKGAQREEIYQRLQLLAFDPDNRNRLWQVIRQDPIISQYVTESDFDRLEADWKHLPYEDEIWTRVDTQVQQLIQAVQVTEPLPPLIPNEEIVS